MIAFHAKVAAARAAAGLSRRAGTGGGTSLPGKLLLRMAPDAIDRLSDRLPDGAVAISATNGKTTTAKMLASMLEPERHLCRNAAGANLASGIASALIRRGDAELGVFEVDEAALEHVVPALRPRVLGLGNLFRDQLDRYGELEAVAARWRRVAEAASGRLVRNADDPLVASLPAGGEPLAYGIDHPAAALGALPHAADSKWCGRCGGRLEYEAVYLGHLGAWSCTSCGTSRPALDVRASDLAFHGLDATELTLSTPLGTRRLRMPLPGLYNVYNALAAVSLGCALGDVSLDRMARGLEGFGAAFGRFERMAVNGRQAVLVLAKNPAGANEVIRTLATDPEPKALVVALNDRIADGRDVSWIWDVDFELLAGGVESVVTSGTRAAEMAVRLKYAGVDPDLLRVEPDPAAALDLSLARGTGPVYALTTYTAMLELRGTLTRRGVVPPYWEAA